MIIRRHTSIVTREDPLARAIAVTLNMLSEGDRMRGTIRVKVIPGDALIQAVQGTGSLIMWNMSAKMNEILALGFDEQVTTRRPPAFNADEEL